MSGKRQREVRELLRAAPDGMTVPQLVDATGIDRRHVNEILADMPDAYIDRWHRGPRNWLAVWCTVEVPPHCPHPVKESHA